MADPLKIDRQAVLAARGRRWAKAVQGIEPEPEVPPPPRLPKAADQHRPPSLRAAWTRYVPPPTTTAMNRGAITWALGARRADAQEDGRGIDIVIASDAGPLYVQVKSSTEAARVWRRQYEQSPIFPRSIVVVYRDALADVQAQMLEQLDAMRARLLRGKG